MFNLFCLMVVLATASTAATARAQTPDLDENEVKALYDKYLKGGSNQQILRVSYTNGAKKDGEFGFLLDKNGVNPEYLYFYDPSAKPKNQFKPFTIKLLTSKQTVVDGPMNDVVQLQLKGSELSVYYAKNALNPLGCAPNKSRKFTIDRDSQGRLSVSTNVGKETKKVTTALIEPNGSVGINNITGK